MTKEQFWQKWIPRARAPMEPPSEVKAEFMADLDTVRPEERSIEDAARYRWFLDECDQERRIEILEIAEGIADLIDHHIDKGRAGL